MRVDLSEWLFSGIITKPPYDARIGNMLVGSDNAINLNFIWICARGFESKSTYDTIFTPETATSKNIKNIAALSDIQGQCDLAVKRIKS